MTQPLLDKVRSVKNRARRLVVLHGICAFGLVVLLAAFLVALADFLLRFQDPGLRVIATSAVATTAVWAFARYVYPPVARRHSDLHVAQQIERCFPELSDRLSTAVAFGTVPDDDHHAGSPALRAATIAETQRIVDRLPLPDCLTARAVYRAALMLLLAAAVIGAVCSFDLDSSLLAARRLVMPWRQESWPRRHALRLTRQPRRLTVGDDFEAEVIDARGRLPDRVELQYRYLDEDQQQSKAMKPIGERMVARIDNLSRSLDYRAVGGDDDTMPWVTLEVVQPPRAVEFAVRLAPPAYTGLPAEDSTRHLRAWEGTEVRIAGRVDQPVRAVCLVADVGGQTQRWPARVTGGRSFFLPATEATPWRLQESGSYYLELTDAAGYTSRDLLQSEIHVRPDAPPTVSVSMPASGSFFTRDALVPLRAVVKDDLAVAAVELVFDERTIRLEAFPAAATRAAPSGSGDPQKPGSRLVEYDWDLGQLDELSEGTTLEFYLRASDFKPQAAESSRVRLTLISADELQTRVDQRQAAIAEHLREAARVQRTARSQIKSLEIQLSEVGRLSQADLDYLQSAELNQRQVTRSLTAEPDGVMPLIQQLLKELESNRVDRPQLFARLSFLVRAVGQLSENELPAIHRDLTLALKSSRARLRESAPAETGAADRLPEPAPSDRAERESLQAAGARQDAVLQQMDELLARLAQWESVRRLAQDVDALRHQQQQLSGEIAALPATGRDVPTLSVGEQAGLKRLAQREREAAREFDRVRSRLAASRSELAASDPLASATLADALESIARDAPGVKMRESAGQIEENRIGQATRIQQEILSGLEHLLDVLANRRADQLQRAAQALAQARDTLRDVTGEQRTLRAELGELETAAAAAERESSLRGLADRQAQLRVQADSLARQLERIQAAEAGRRVAQAADRMASSAAAQSQQRTADAVRAADDALAQLSEADRQLQASLQQGQRALRAAQYARLRQRVTQLLAQQRSLQLRTRDLFAARASRSDTPPPAERALWENLAADQRDLGQETADERPHEALPEAFRFALRRASRAMLEAVGLLRAAIPDDAVRDSQQQALDHLQQVLQSLAETRPTPPGPTPPGPTPPGPTPPGGAGPRNAQAIAADLPELRLLRSMQRDLQQQTGEMQRLQSEPSASSDAALRRLAALAADQGRLAELVRQMLPAVPPEAARTASPPRDALDEELDRALQDAGLPDFLEQ